mmetsp:Transcript_100790/g.289654  ORF Transcript_100790/g.289654 Transcript_100790/m.289654 type:complete len:235 (-) Transcript_100790:258-962(-)
MAGPRAVAHAHLFRDPHRLKDQERAQRRPARRVHDRPSRARSARRLLRRKHEVHDDLRMLARTQGPQGEVFKAPRFAGDERQASGIRPRHGAVVLDHHLRADGDVARARARRHADAPDAEGLRRAGAGEHGRELRGDVTARPDILLHFDADDEGRHADDLRGRLRRRLRLRMLLHRLRHRCVQLRRLLLKCLLRRQVPRTVGRRLLRGLVFRGPLVHVRRRLERGEDGRMEGER